LTTVGQRLVEFAPLANTPEHTETMSSRLNHTRWISTASFILIVLLGCRSPYYADRGAAAGGLAGAGVGALVGNAVGSTVAGTAIGAGVGALTGGAIGGALDDVAAQNRAQIAAQMGRPVTQGAASVQEVVAMSHAGVDSNLIANYINTSGVARPITAQDVIYLHQQGVATQVIDTMQRPQPRQPVQVATVPAPPVVVQEHHYGAPYYCPPQRHIYYRHHPTFHHHPHVGFGVSVSH